MNAPIATIIMTPATTELAIIIIVSVWLRALPSVFIAGIIEEEGDGDKLVRGGADLDALGCTDCVGVTVGVALMDGTIFAHVILFVLEPDK